MTETGEDTQETRASIVDYARRMARDRLVTGTAGNISVLVRNRDSARVAITPTGVDYDRMQPVDVALVDLDGRPAGEGLRPSSELPMHLAIYRRRPDVGAVVHTHSTFATTLSIAGRAIPAIHYYVAALGATEIPVTPRYALYGTDELAELAVSTMGEGRAVLLRNHGAVAVGRSLEEAYTNALLVETLAELYYRALLIGGANVLSAEQLAEVSAKLRGYGQQT